MKLTKTSKIRIFAVSTGAAVNLLLFFIKLYIGLSVNSVAIYTDAVNSLADCAVCIAAAVGFCFISSKPDPKYPFGMGRSEDLLNLLISSVIVVTGFAFAYTSLERLMYPMPVWYSSLYAVIIAVTAAVKLLLVFLFKAASKKYGSQTLKGIEADSLLDFFITLCTLISFTLSEKVSFSVDGAAGMIISLILIVQGIKAAVFVCKKIAGRRDDELCEKVKKFIEENGIECCDIQCHGYGEVKVFTADINAQEKDISEIIRKFENEFNFRLYLNFGGKDDKQKR